jgi:hypothetical protein
VDLRNPWPLLAQPVDVAVAGHVVVVVDVGVVLTTVGGLVM